MCVSHNIISHKQTMISSSSTSSSLTGSKYVPPHLRKSQGSGANPPPPPSNNNSNNNSNTEEPRHSYSRNYSSSSSFGSGRGNRGGGGYERGYPDKGSYPDNRGAPNNNSSSFTSTGSSSRWNVEESAARSNGGASSYARRENAPRSNARGFHGDMTPDKRLEQRLFHQKDKQTTGINFDNYDKIPCEISGSNVPEPIEVYSEDTIGGDLFRNTQLCNYTRPTPVQKYSIPIGQQGRDLMACAQTGSGVRALDTPWCSFLSLYHFLTFYSISIENGRLSLSHHHGHDQGGRTRKPRPIAS